ncbi:MAG TPA: hypothetical protein ENK35_03335 [Candidatus Tenderia sp.]|nr:hypothetical protein [Candidatus Tenderia sp.]
MLIFRLIIAIAIIWLLFYVYRRIHKRVANKRQLARRAPETKDMVRCEQCGLHIPSTEAIERAGHYYCCQEHAEQQ